MRFFGSLVNFKCWFDAYYMGIAFNLFGETYYNTGIAKLYNCQ